MRVNEVFITFHLIAHCMLRAKWNDAPYLKYMQHVLSVSFPKSEPTRARSSVGGRNGEYWPARVRKRFPANVFKRAK